MRRMEDLTVLQVQVVDAAKSQIKHKPWFKGVCLDNLQTDSVIKKEGVMRCADVLVCDTMFWDADAP